MNKKALENQLADLVDRMELVLHFDWEFTKEALSGETQEQFIQNTFLQPGVEDEANNWGNRGSLLRSYRDAKRLLGQTTTL